MANTKSLEERNSGGRSFMLWFITIVALLAIGGAAYLYKQVRDLKKDSQMGNIQSNQEQLRDRIGKLINLPDENPTVANVTDKEKLKDQPFFKDAQNGDSLLIFPAAKKAIIYRESENRLINVGPIAITSDKEMNKDLEVSADNDGEGENTTRNSYREADKEEEKTVEKSDLRSRSNKEEEEE